MPQKDSNIAHLVKLAFTSQWNRSFLNKQSKREILCITTCDEEGIDRRVLPL